MLKTQDRVLILEGSDPMRNLAVEEALLSFHNSLTDGFDPVIVFYVNAPTVVVGKFQNPWLECDVDWVASDKVPILRRVSGGGTVWHDLGNINYSFIVPRVSFDQKADLSLLVAVLSKLGAKVESNERGDLLLDGMKVSGNAMCYKNTAVLHHGTILVDSDLARLRRALRVEVPQFFEVESVGVKSKRSQVRSLGDLNHNRTLHDWLFSIAEGIAGYWNCKVKKYPAETLFEAFATGSIQLSVDWNDLSTKYQQWEWNFGHTPKFSVRMSQKNQLWSVENGLVRSFVNSGGKEYVFDPAPRFGGFSKLEILEAFGSAA